MNRLSPERRKQVVAALVEGNSIRATVRMTGVAKNTVTKLLVDLGTVCSIYQDRVMRRSPRAIRETHLNGFVHRFLNFVKAEARGETSRKLLYLTPEAAVVLLVNHDMEGSCGHSEKTRLLEDTVGQTLTVVLPTMLGKGYRSFARFLHVRVLRRTAEARRFSSSSSFA